MTAQTFNVFHGTATRFESFDLSHGGENTSHPGSEHGIFFAGRRADADHYARLAVERAEGDATEIIYSVTVTCERPLIIDESDLDDDTLDAIADDDAAAFDYAYEHGFDAIIWPHGNMNNAGWTIAIMDERQATITE